MNLTPILAVSVLLLWDDLQGDEVFRYQVYVGIDSLVAGNPPLLMYETKRHRYRARGLQFGTTYYFAVKGICSNGTSTPYSNEVVYTPMPWNAVHSDLYFDPEDESAP